MDNKTQPQAGGGASRPVRRNIESVARLEQQSVENRSLPDRIADWIGGFTGSLKFVALHAVIYGLWIIVNLGAIPGIKPFDPFPFLLLSVVVSVEAIFLSTFVLMKQNRMSRRADQRAHLDLQINLLAEREMTLLLRLLHRMAASMGVRLSNEEIEELCEETSVEEVFRELLERMPEE
jgi:uncharacterized membrane protein